MGELIRVVAIDEMPVGSMKSVETNNIRILVCRLEEGFFAVADECSHDFVPISTGALRGKEVVCPRHGAKFNVQTGKPTAPPAVADIDTYETRIEDGCVYVVLD